MAIAKSILTLPDFSFSPHIDQVGTEERKQNERAETGAEYDRPDHS